MRCLSATAGPRRPAGSWNPGAGEAGAAPARWPTDGVEGDRGLSWGSRSRRRLYLYGLDLDETGSADPLSVVEKVLYLTAAMTGMRQGELLALRWMDVDWDSAPGQGAA